MAEEYEQRIKSLLADKRGLSDKEAVSKLEGLLGFNNSQETSSPEQKASQLYEGRVIQGAMDYINEHPGNWYEQSDQTSQQERKPARKTSIRINFEGQKIKTVTDEKGKTTTYQQDSKGEYLPVVSKKNQAHETSILLSMIEEGDFDGIKDLGYNIKKAERDDEDGTEEKKE